MANSRPYFLFKPVTDEPYSSYDVENKLEERKRQLDDAQASLREDTKQRKARQTESDESGYEDESNFERECLGENSEERRRIMSEKTRLGAHKQLFDSNPEQYTDLYNQFGDIMDELALNGRSFMIDSSTIKDYEADDTRSIFDMDEEEIQRLASAEDEGEISVKKRVEKRMDGDNLAEHYDQTRSCAQRDLLQDGVKAAAIEEDAEGNLILSISLLRPAGTSFSICNGMVSFDTTGMDEAQMTAMIDFLQRHGLPVDTSSLKLENADEETTRLFDNAVEKVEKERGNPESDDDEREDDGEESPVANEDDSRGDDDWPEEEPEPGAAPEAKEPEEESEEPVKATVKAPKGRTPEELLKQLSDTVSASWTKFGEKNIRWRLGYSAGGWTTFTMYDSDYIGFDRHEADIDPKSKNVKLNYSRKYWMRVHNGRLEFAYTGKMGDGEIYEFVSQLYACKVKYVRFEGIPEEQESKLREACGKRLIIPIGHKISAERYNKMADAAGKKYGKNSPEYHRYRYDLAQEMRRQLRDRGIKDPLDGKNRSIQECREIRWAEAAYRLYPFRNMWEDYGRKEGNGLRYLYEEKLNENIGPNCNDGATKVIGAKLAFARMFDMYEEYGRDGATIQDFITNRDLKAEEKAALQKFVKEKGIDTSLPLHRDEINKRDGMDPLIFEVLFEAMCKSEEQTAKEQIENVYEEKLKSVGRNQDPEQYAVKQCLENAERKIRAIGDVMEKEFGFPRLTVIPGGIPRHNFDDYKEKHGLMKTATREEEREEETSKAGKKGPSAAEIAKMKQGQRS